MEQGPLGEGRVGFAPWTRVDARVIAVIELLKAGGNTPVSELARKVSLSTSRLEHLFKQHTCCSIRQFVRQRRLQVAARLIALTSERISVISYSVGFSDVCNFNHAFKRQFGVSPKIFRVQMAQRHLPRNSRYNQFFQIVAEA